MAGGSNLLVDVDQAGLQTNTALATLPTESIISNELANFAKKVVKNDNVMDIYLQTTPGTVRVGGGSFGAQDINALVMTIDLQQFIKDTFTRLDPLIDLDFRFITTKTNSDLDFYVDNDIQVGGSGTTLGIALSNSSSSRNWWELALNGPALQNQPDYLRYATIHEFGHALGLEHPFDNGDGDFYGSTNSGASAYPEDSVMSYRSPLGGSWPTWYSSNDILALQKIWGLEQTAIVKLPTYSITSSTSLINEGSTLTVSIVTTNVNAGGILYYSYSGIKLTDEDFSSGKLIGFASVGSDGALKISHTVANDLSTEGDEILSFKLFSDSNLSNQVGPTLNLTIVDTSTTPIIPNRGNSSFLLSGRAVVGSLLSISKTADDPEGNGNFIFKWQSSSDGVNWAPLQSNKSTYTITAADISKQIRAIIGYTDGKNFTESVSTNNIAVETFTSNKLASTNFSAPADINIKLPVYQMTGNWDIDKFYYYVENYPVTLRTAFNADYLAGRNTNEAVYGENHYLNWGKQEGRLLPEVGGFLLDPNDYGAYVENYGITLLDVYRLDPRTVLNGGTMSLFAWGKEHYNNWGKAEGREITGGVDWGGIVRNNLDLYNQWQDELRAKPGISAFAWGYQNQNLIKTTAGVFLGSPITDKLTGQIAYGLNSNDVICSDGGRGILSGGFGDDLLVAANGGSDCVYGGPGSDVFQLNLGSNLNIRDFRKGADMIQLGSALTSSAVTMLWESDENTTYFYAGSISIGKVFGKLPTDFTYADSINGVAKVYI